MSRLRPFTVNIVSEERFSIKKGILLNHIQADMLSKSNDRNPDFYIELLTLLFFVLGPNAVILATVKSS